MNMKCFSGRSTLLSTHVNHYQQPAIKVQQPKDDSKLNIYSRHAQFIDPNMKPQHSPVFEPRQGISDEEITVVLPRQSVASTLEGEAEHQQQHPADLHDDQSEFYQLSAPKPRDDQSKQESDSIHMKDPHHLQPEHPKQHAADPFQGQVENSQQYTVNTVPEQAQHLQTYSEDAHQGQAEDSWQSTSNPLVWETGRQQQFAVNTHDGQVEHRQEDVADPLHEQVEIYQQYVSDRRNEQAFRKRIPTTKLKQSMHTAPVVEGQPKHYKQYYQPGYRKYIDNTIIGSSHKVQLKQFHKASKTPALVTKRHPHQAAMIPTFTQKVYGDWVAQWDRVYKRWFYFNKKTSEGL